MSKRLLITGADGFTGRHLSLAAEAAGYEVFPLAVDLTDRQAVVEGVRAIGPSHVVHLAAISAVTHDDALALYQVNVLGTQHLLDALIALNTTPERILLASSANVYGNVDLAFIPETLCPQPVNHYAISKLAMEHLAQTYAARLPLLIVRPFNYTGVGHDDRFVIPKIVDHFVQGAPVIELGNLFVEREYNDVRGVCARYLALLDQGHIGDTYNICSGRTATLQSVIDTLSAISGHSLEVHVNPAFVRANEIKTLAGDPTRLNDLVGDLPWPALEDTLRWMYEAKASGLATA